MNLCQDVIHEILNYCDSKTAASLACATAHLYFCANAHQKLKDRKKLKVELDKSKSCYKSYYKQYILNLKVNVRVTDTYFNYRILQTDNKMCLLQKVNMLGDKIDNQIIYTVLDKKDWVIHYYDEVGHYTKSTLNFGIIKHDYGPLIKSVNSHYLNFITKPFCNSTSSNYYAPELYMLTPVFYKNYFYEYYITNISYNKLTLSLIDTTVSIKNQLECYFDKTWKCKNAKYQIGRFGSWKC